MNKKKNIVAQVQGEGQGNHTFSTMNKRATPCTRLPLLYGWMYAVPQAKRLFPRFELVTTNKWGILTIVPGPPFVLNIE